MWNWFKNLFGKNDCEACGNNPIISQPTPIHGDPDRKCPKPAQWPMPPHIEALADAGAVPALLRHAMECAQRCPTCYGNDGNMPCAYPSAKAEGCLRDKRLAREALEGRIAAAAKRRPPPPRDGSKRRTAESSAPNRSRSNADDGTAMGVSLALASSVAQTPTYTGGGGLSGGAGASGGWDSPAAASDTGSAPTPD